jgi:hypothetical protein
MRLIIVLAAVAIISSALILSLASAWNPANATGWVAALILAAGAAIQRAGVVSGWFKPSKRKQIVDAVARGVHEDVRSHHAGAAGPPEVWVHVWEVPHWFRRLTRPAMRQRLLSSDPLKRPHWLYPRLSRLAIVPDRAPSRVRFPLGYGAVGICVSQANDTVFLTVDVRRPEYLAGLRSEDEWSNLPTALTHNMAWDDALRLSERYERVIARVILHPGSGEALGCTTISVCGGSGPFDQEFAKAKLRSAEKILQLVV